MSKHKDSNYNQPNIQYCQYCGKECKNLNSLKQHEIRCKKNPDRIISALEKYSKNPHEAWNKGLTKETDIRIELASEKASKTLKGRPGHPHTEEFKEKQRQNALKRGLGGFNMRRGIFYNGIKLDSSYEVILAEDLDKNNII